MKRVLIIGSQHGNELLGERLYRYIQNQPTSADLRVSFELANPKARRLGVRYVESDMNRSYTGATTTYEEQRAQELLARLANHSYDLVIDAHTTTVDQAPCFIVPDIDKFTAPYLRASRVKHVVRMRHEFVRRSLIGNVPCALSLEISNAQLGLHLFAQLYQDLLNFARGSGRYPRKIVYEVEDVIAKSSLAPGAAARLKNFARSPEGFYPLLVGENSYKKQTDYLGFKAKTRKRMMII